MKGNRAVLTAVVIVVLVVAGWWLFKRSNRGPSVDLLATFETAQKQPEAGTNTVIEADLNGDKKRAIFTVPPSRIKWKTHVPEDGWLKVDLGMKPESWDKEGNGVWFYVGVSDGHTYEELFSQHLDPFNNKSDRRWVPVFVDLSAYSGEDVEVVFNARTSAERTPEDPRNDLPLWGAPEIVIR
jgi:hypothetical protein